MVGVGRLAQKPGLTPAHPMSDAQAMTGREGKRWIDGPLPWLAYLPFYAVPWLWRTPNAAELAASIVGLLLFLPVYVVGYRQAGARLIAAALAVAAIAVALAPIGGNWTVIAIYGAALAGAVRPARRGVLAIAAIAGLVAATGFLLDQPLMWWVPGLLLIVMTGFGTISREALYDRNRALLAAQEEVRRLAGTAERERIARDLHDVVGRTLTLVALKADLAVKLSGRDQAAAEVEMRGVAAAAREGLAEVRAALAGVAAGGLGREAAASHDALTAAGVKATVRGDPHAVAADAGAVLAMTLREAITNVIRHADAAHCTVDIDIDGAAARLTVTDDGRGSSFREGHGLTGMRQRLLAAGGSLAVGPGEPGTRLVATVPVAA
jgi:two-component system, NarL family, sensor histidine kinase DesK